VRSKDGAEQSEKGVVLEWVVWLGVGQGVGAIGAEGNRLLSCLGARWWTGVCVAVAVDDASTEVEWNVLITSLYCNDMEGVIRIESYSVYMSDIQGCLGCTVLSSHLYMKLSTTQSLTSRVTSRLELSPTHAILPSASS
jgi:hypothetical protein